MGRVPVLQQRNADLIYIKRILENACGRLGIPSPWDGQDLNRQQLNTMIGEHLLPQPQENEFAAHPHTGSKEFGVPFLQMILQIQKISGVSLDKMPYLLALTHVMWTGADPHMSDIPMPTTITKFLHLSTSLDDFKWLEEAVSLSSAFSLMDDESKRLNRANSLLMMTAMQCREFNEHFAVFAASAKLVDLAYLVSTGAVDTCGQIMSWLRWAHKQAGLCLALTTAICCDHCTSAMATAAGVEHTIQVECNDSSITVPTTGESLHGLHLELTHFCFAVSPKTDWHEFSLSTFMSKLA